MVKEEKKLILIDSHAFIHRAFHALPPRLKIFEQFNY